MLDPKLTVTEASLFTGVSRGNLAQLRYKGTGPSYLKPTPRTVLYRQSVLEQWLKDSERTGTSAVAA